MLQMADGKRGAQSVRVRMAVEDIVRHVHPRDTLSQLAAIYYWYMAHHHYMKDPVPAEMVKDPQRVFEEVEKSGLFLGDCDDAATFLTGASRSIGIKAVPVRVGFRKPRAVTLGSVRGRPVRATLPTPFTHVLAVARDQYGRTVVLDPVAGSSTDRMLRRTKRFG